jgi:hypothetical protein
MLVNLADTSANRAFSGTTGTAGGSSPFPRARIVAVIARAGRAMLAAITGQAGTGEQTLLRRLVKRRPELFAGLVVCFDRNFPGHDRVLVIVQAGGHVVARVKEGISLATHRATLLPAGGARALGEVRCAVESADEGIDSFLMIYTKIYIK